MPSANGSGPRPSPARRSTPSTPSRVRRRGRARRPAGRMPAPRPARSQSLPRRGGGRRRSRGTAPGSLRRSARRGTPPVTGAPRRVVRVRAMADDVQRHLRQATGLDRHVDDAYRARALRPPAPTAPAAGRPGDRTRCRPEGGHTALGDYSIGRSDAQRVQNSPHSGLRGAPSPASQRASRASNGRRSAARTRPTWAARSTRRADPTRSASACGSSTGAVPAGPDHRLDRAVARADAPGRSRPGRTARRRPGRAGGSAGSSRAMRGQLRQEQTPFGRSASMTGETLPGTWTSVKRSARGIQLAEHLEHLLAAAHAGQPVVDQRNAVAGGGGRWDPCGGVVGACHTGWGSCMTSS